MLATICERCGRRSVDKAVHNDLYHPLPRPRKTEPTAEVSGDDVIEPLPDPKL